MKKIFAALAAIAVICASVAWAQTGGYVRKKIEPNFFIPKSAQPKPEKLPMPYYKQPVIPAEETTVPAPQEQPLPVVEQTQNTAPTTAAKAPAPVVAPTPAEKSVVQNLSDTPEYQRKYQEYLQDLEYIAATGERPSNANLDNDLKQMNSNERIKLDQKFNAKRNVKAEFEKTLNQILAK